MALRTLVLTVLLPLVVSAVALGRVSARATPDESWADSQRGWTANPPARCKPRRDVCATEDGGATWHGIFNGGTFVFGVVRTSAAAGVVSTGRQVAARYWTRDNGRHWYRTSQIGSEFQGSGKFIFSVNSGQPGPATDFAKVLYRTRPWPPTGKAKCRGPWTAAAFETAPAKGGNVCGGPPIDGGMRAARVAKLVEGRFSGLANVPGGVLATVTESSLPRVLLYQQGRQRVVDLPGAGGLVPCAGFNREPIVTWPRITVLGCTGSSGDPSGGWLSEDGGRSWRVLTS
jgi:hypothetical protein